MIFIGFDQAFLYFKKTLSFMRYVNYHKNIQWTGPGQT